MKFFVHSYDKWFCIKSWQKFANLLPCKASSKRWLFERCRKHSRSSCLSEYIENSDLIKSNRDNPSKFILDPPLILNVSATTHRYKFIQKNPQTFHSCIVANIYFWGMRLLSLWGEERNVRVLPVTFLHRKSFALGCIIVCSSYTVVACHLEGFRVMTHDKFEF